MPVQLSSYTADRSHDADPARSIGKKVVRITSLRRLTSHGAAATMPLMRPRDETPAQAGTTLDAPVPPAIALQGLHKSFGAVQAVNGITLTIEAGEIVAFLGPNGAG